MSLRSPKQYRDSECACRPDTIAWAIAGAILSLLVCGAHAQPLSAIVTNTAAIQGRTSAEAREALELTGTRCPQSMTQEERRAAFGGAAPAAGSDQREPIAFRESAGPESHAVR